MNYDLRAKSQAQCMTKLGRIFVISAPSGSGKTTICKRVLKKIKGILPSVSVTTRRPRPDEKNGKDYYYISKSEFKKKVKNGGLLEWEKNFGNFYGTPKDFVLRKTEEGKDVLLSIDVKGAIEVKKKFPQSALIFVKPPSLSELSSRLKKRNTDRGSEIAKRLKIAEKELSYADRYDYVVVNSRLEDAVGEVISIIAKERKLKKEKGE